MDIKDMKPIPAYMNAANMQAIAWARKDPSIPIFRVSAVNPDSMNFVEYDIPKYDADAMYRDFVSWNFIDPKIVQVR